MCYNKQAVSFMNNIHEFSVWVNSSLADLDVEEIHDIYADFVQSNEHIIEKINKILYPSYYNNNNNK